MVEGLGDPASHYMARVEEKFEYYSAAQDACDIMGCSLPAASYIDEDILFASVRADIGREREDERVLAATEPHAATMYSSTYEAWNLALNHGIERLTRAVFVYTTKYNDADGKIIRPADAKSPLFYEERIRRYSGEISRCFRFMPALKEGQFFERSWASSFDRPLQIFRKLLASIQDIEDHAQKIDNQLDLKTQLLVANAQAESADKSLKVAQIALIVSILGIFVSIAAIILPLFQGLTTAH